MYIYLHIVLSSIIFVSNIEVIFFQGEQTLKIIFSSSVLLLIWYHLYHFGSEICLRNLVEFMIYPPSHHWTVQKSSPLFVESCKDSQNCPSFLGIVRSCLSEMGIPISEDSKRCLMEILKWFPSDYHLSLPEGSEINQSWNMDHRMLIYTVPIGKSRWLWGWCCFMSPRSISRLFLGVFSWLVN